MKMVKLFAHIEPGCESGSLLGFPSWNKYLHTHKFNNVCDVQFGSFRDVWAIAAAGFEILLRLGALIAAGFIIFGAIKLAMSQGEPDRIKSGKETIINAVVGLVIAILASFIVSIIAKSLIP